MIVTVNGMTVELRDRYPVREFDDLVAKFQNFVLDAPWKHKANFLMRFVVAWDFAGDPKDVEAWGDLDTFSEMTAIYKAVGELLNTKIQFAKLSGSESTTSSEE